MPTIVFPASLGKADNYVVSKVFFSRYCIAFVLQLVFYFSLVFKFCRFHIKDLAHSSQWQGCKKK